MCTIKASHLFWLVSYDGFVEKRKQGTGLQYLTGMPSIPATYRISYVVYLRKD